MTQREASKDEGEGPTGDFGLLDIASVALIDAIADSGWWLGDWKDEAQGTDIMMRPHGVFTHSDMEEGQEGTIWLSLLDGTIRL